MLSYAAFSQAKHRSGASFSVQCSGKGTSACLNQSPANFQLSRPYYTMIYYNTITLTLIVNTINATIYNLP